MMTAVSVHGIQGYLRRSSFSCVGLNFVESLVSDNDVKDFRNGVSALNSVSFPIFHNEDTFACWVYIAIMG